LQEHHYLGGLQAVGEQMHYAVAASGGVNITKNGRFENHRAIS
jgi:hypothetical protein